VVLAVALFALDGRTIRVTGTIEATHSVILQVPILEESGGKNLTLIKLIPNGSNVRAGDLLAEFDDTAQLVAAREAEAKFDDLSHQVEQKRAEHTSNVEKRLSELEAAEADEKKAVIDLKKGPILSEIELEKDKLKASDAHEHVASLRRSGARHDEVEVADTRILELQRDRQKIALNRQRLNSGRLSLRAPISGMVALQNIWRNSSMGHAEEGDQLSGGNPLLQVFDPTKMQVSLSVSEADGKVIKSGTRALVHLDAFPNLVMPAHFERASPVASSGLGSPVKTFKANFVLDANDTHLTPDLSASVEIQAEP
jgi:multidrug resistance efflux pump